MNKPRTLNANQYLLMEEDKTGKALYFYVERRSCLKTQKLPLTEEEYLAIKKTTPVNSSNYGRIHLKKTLKVARND